MLRSAPLPAPRRLAWLPLLAIFALLLPACLSRSKAGLPGARAVIIYPRGMERQANTAERRLRGEGLRVEKQVQGPLGRGRSSLTVYDLSRYPDRAEELADVLEPLGPLEIAGFRRRGSGGTDVVLWLVPDEPTGPEQPAGGPRED